MKLNKTDSLIKKYRKSYKKCKVVEIEGLICESSKEVQFVKECKSSKNPLPKKAETITTPYGKYTPDFEFPDRYVEVKGIHTFMTCLGFIGYRGKAPKSNKQWMKIKWVATHIKPVDIIIFLSNKEAIPVLDIKAPKVNISIRGGCLLVLS